MICLLRTRINAHRRRCCTGLVCLALHTSLVTVSSLGLAGCTGAADVGSADDNVSPPDGTDEPTKPLDPNVPPVTDGGRSPIAPQIASSTFCQGNRSLALLCVNRGRQRTGSASSPYEESLLKSRQLTHGRSLDGNADAKYT